MVLLVLTGLATWIAGRVVGDQERRLLQERAREVSLVLSTSVSAIPTSLASMGATMRATGASPAAFMQAAQTEITTPNTAYALLRPAGAGYRVELAAGSGLRAGELLSGAAAQAAVAAARSGQTVATPVTGTGAGRSIGFALGPPAAPAGTVIYRQITLGQLSAPRQAATAPFHEVRVALYAAPRAAPTQVVVATTPTLPLRGAVVYLPVSAGSIHWLLAVNALHPLVGSVAGDAPWLLLVAGVIGSLLIVAVLAAETRRRRTAVALYAGEHRLAETLQRSLLPTLPPLDGLDTAARYLPGGSMQQVGGDWFDAFAVHGGQLGLVIGDVIGHDLAAATAMSQIRATLRAYAWHGEAPAAVLAQLELLVNAFGLAELVTVFYAVLGPPDPDGNRVLTYANAGHLPPLVRAANGDVRLLSGGASVVIGAPGAEARPQAVEHLGAGATLLLYTDGLVEVPGEALDDSISRLADLLRAQPPAEGVEALCERVVTGCRHDGRQDDIAVLAVQLTERSGGPSRHPGTAPPASARAARDWAEPGRSLAPRVVARRDATSEDLGLS